MDILIVGNGGREQALAEKLAESDETDNIYVAQGNAGTESIRNAENIDISPLDIQELASFALQKRIGLTVVGQDDPLANGIVDEFKDRKLTIFGPTKQQARVEWDREFAKRIEVPRGAYAHFDSPDGVMDYVAHPERVWPLYVKDNYLAQGKGALCCEDTGEVEGLIDSLITRNFFREDGSVVIEDYVGGDEGSHHAFCDGKTHLSIPFIIRDHKTLTEDSSSPMTGGMGTIGPIRTYTPADVEKLGDTFVSPAVKALGFKGLLFAGLKGGKGDEKLIEWNARFGDPETQVFMRLLKSDLLPVLMACVEGKLDNLTPPQWHHDRSVACIVMAAPGYPNSPKHNGIIEGIQDAEQITGVSILQAGTTNDGLHLRVAGGRVLNVVAEAATLESALNIGYAAADRITSTPPLQVRRGIGQTAL